MTKLKSIWLIRFFIVGLFVLHILITPALDAQPRAKALQIPSLTAVINSPSNDSTIQVCNDFTVSAVVTCQLVITSNWNNIVLANGLIPAQDVTMTITITGPASTQEPLTKPANPTVLNPGQVGLASWTLHCDGPGDVTITVAPSGIYDLDQIPIPIQNLFSDTVVIHQEEEQQQTQITQTTPSSSYVFNELQYRQPSDANMTTTTVYVQPRQTIAGQPVTIFGNIANRGELAGNYTATLKINGEIEQIKEGTLSGNIAKPLKFTVYRDKPGIYKVDINGQETYFTIVDSRQNSGNKVTPGIIFFALMFVLLISSLVVLLSQR